MSDVPTYQIDQKIVYPSQGVGKITDITTKKFKDQELNYYVIYLEVSDMTVMVPVNKAEDLGIRAIVTEAEARQALELIGEPVDQMPSDWKLRYQMNMDLLKKGSVNDIASIVRSLYNRSKVKELPILERKLYDSAKKLLEDEISFALDLSTKEVENLIHSKLEPFGESADSHHSFAKKDEFDDDDEEEFEEVDMPEDEDEDDDGDMDE